MSHEALGVIASVFPFLDWHGFFFLLFAGVACVVVLIICVCLLLPSSTSNVLRTGKTAGAPSGKDQSLQHKTASCAFIGTTGDFDPKVKADPSPAAESKET